MKPVMQLFVTMIAAACLADQPYTPDEAWPNHDACEILPRPGNAALPLKRGVSDWYQVRLAAQDVYALIEPFQFQETISYLILGEERALLFDTGLGMVPIRPVVEVLTDLPVQVLNSHTHYDHVGGNAEFESVLAVDLPYTHANMRGFPRAELAGEVADQAFCKGPPEGLDTAAFRTRAWRASGFVSDGEIIDLGGRQLEILQVPGHTPDALALLDRANGLLWTGDSYYDGGLWLFVPETDLDAYEASMARLAALVPAVKQLLPAHNAASADPEKLVEAASAVVKIRSGQATGTPESGNRLVFEVDGVTVLTARQVLDGETPDVSGGGSGLTTWPE